MNTYEVRLVCPFCPTFTVLGTVEAESTYDAKPRAAERWPDARYEEMKVFVNGQQVVTNPAEIDPGQHSDEHPFCSDASCPCHEDREQVNLLNDQIDQGLLTPREATLIMSGRAI